LKIFNIGIVFNCFGTEVMF